MSLVEESKIGNKVESNVFYRRFTGTIDFESIADTPGTGFTCEYEAEKIGKAVIFFLKEPDQAGTTGSGNNRYFESTTVLPLLLQQTVAQENNSVAYADVNSTLATVNLRLSGTQNDTKIRIADEPDTPFAQGISVTLEPSSFIYNLV